MDDKLIDAYRTFMIENDIRPGCELIKDCEIRDGKLVTIATYIVNPGEAPRKIWPAEEEKFSSTGY